MKRMSEKRGGPAEIERGQPRDRGPVDTERRSRQKERGSAERQGLTSWFFFYWTKMRMPATSDASPRMERITLRANLREPAIPRRPASLERSGRGLSSSVIP